MSTPAARNGRKVFGTAGLFLCLSIAMLVWMKLRLVTNLPRSVYAEPAPRQPQPETPKAQAKPEKDKTQAHAGE